MMLWTREQRAFISWLTDLAAVAVVVILFQAWISDLQQSDEKDEMFHPPHYQLAESFLEAGFCNSPTVDTQFLCACFDISAGLLFLATAGLLKLQNKKNNENDADNSRWLVPPAVYLLSHGFGHYQAYQMQPLKELSTLEMSTKDMMTLAIILSIGPMDGMKTVLQRMKKESDGSSADQDKKLLYGGASVAVAVLVALYKYGLGQRQNFALLYINITILFTSALPRLLLVGYNSKEDVSDRVDQHPYFGAKMMARTAVILLVFVEPFYCDAFLARWGGHFLFDVSLFCDALCNVVDRITVEKQNKTVKVE